MTIQTFWIGTKENGIDVAKLNQEHYFQDLFQEAYQRKLLTEEEVRRIQMELLELLSKEVERYTNDESTSIPVEKAQELLQSITYSIGSYLKSLLDCSVQVKLLQEEKLSTLFLQGMQTVEHRKASAQAQLTRLTQGCLRLDNIAYQDTILTGLPKFFHDYNIEFAAHDTPADIDYPTFILLTDLIGVEYMEEYLRRMCLENDFLSCFSTTVLNQLIRSFDQEASHMLINLFELTLINALGCKLLDKETKILDIDSQELVWLQEKLSKLSKEELRIVIDKCFLDIVSDFNLAVELVEYVNPELSNLIDRLTHNLDTNTLSHFFQSFNNAWQDAYECLEEGEIMPDYKLRNLIERIESKRTIADKVALIMEEVRSTTDLIELLEECFYDGDYEEIFHILGKDELLLLKKRLLYDAGGIPQEDFEPQGVWQEVLWKYLHSIF